MKLQMQQQYNTATLQKRFVPTCAASLLPTQCTLTHSHTHTPYPPPPQVDPLDDIDVINLELALADLAQIEKRVERLKKGECGVRECQVFDTGSTVPHSEENDHLLTFSCIALP